MKVPADEQSHGLTLFSTINISTQKWKKKRRFGVKEHDHSETASAKKKTRCYLDRITLRRFFATTASGLFASLKVDDIFGPVEALPEWVAVVPDGVAQ